MRSAPSLQPSENIFNTGANDQILVVMCYPRGEDWGSEGETTGTLGAFHLAISTVQTHKGEPISQWERETYQTSYDVTKATKNDTKYYNPRLLLGRCGDSSPLWITEDGTRSL